MDEGDFFKQVMQEVADLIDELPVSHTFHSNFYRLHAVYLLRN